MLIGYTNYDSPIAFGSCISFGLSVCICVWGWELHSSCLHLREWTCFGIVIQIEKRNKKLQNVSAASFSFQLSTQFFDVHIICVINWFKKRFERQNRRNEEMKWNERNEITPVSGRHNILYCAMEKFVWCHRVKMCGKLCAHAMLYLCFHQQSNQHQWNPSFRERLEAINETVCYVNILLIFRQCIKLTRKNVRKIRNS